MEDSRAQDTRLLKGHPGPEEAGMGQGALTARKRCGPDAIWESPAQLPSASPPAASPTSVRRSHWPAEQEGSLCPAPWSVPATWGQSSIRTRVVVPESGSHVRCEGNGAGLGTGTGLSEGQPRAQAPTHRSPLTSSYQDELPGTHHTHTCKSLLVQVIPPRSELTSQGPLNPSWRPQVHSLLAPSSPDL